ncbi:response regulator transcription factor [Syntrophomonas wolfei]|jgi:DNA-binding response OmpR family regulator|uniref:response regulator transcription factor n=1 Tax=Syntrophomonas wolfei TaxID=863 RepID=UPI0007730F26|nr:response regulator transcription factor [Syntrophomonas wolfei]
MRLLLVEDERQLAEALSELLIKNRYAVDVVCDGEAGLDYALTGIYDLVILDIMLPRMNGLEILRQLRLNGISSPVMLLTAKGELEDKVSGLDSGADDYLVKPFAAEELLARIRALSRRKGEMIVDDTLDIADFTLNLSTYELEGKNSSVRLTRKEFDIMRYFVYRPNRVLSKDELIEKVWGFDSEADYNNIEVYISFLRKKLAHIGSQAAISTLRGIGYKLEV